MNTGFTYKKNPWIGFVLVGLVFLLFMLAEMWNSRFWLSDFEVYYKAAARILQGQNLYRIKADDFYIFKYSPVSAVFFIPFALLPFGIAKVAYWLLYSFIMLACIYLALRLVSRFRPIEKPSRVNNLVILTGLILMVHFLRELHLGQVTFILLLLYLLACRYLLAGKPGMVGLLISVSLFIKPFGLIFLPYLLYKRKWKELAYIMVYFGLLCMLPLLFYRSLEMTLSQYGAWFHEVLVELGNKQEFSMPANQTIFSVIARYAFLGGLLNTPMLFMAFQSFVLIILAGLMIFLMQKGKRISFREIPEWSFLMGLIPLLAFSGENSFCLFLPAIVLILFMYPDLPLPVKIMAIAGFLLLGGNMHDLWGDNLSSWIDKVSLISFGAISLCSVLAWLRVREFL